MVAFVPGRRQSGCSFHLLGRLGEPAEALQNLPAYGREEVVTHHAGVVADSVE